mmetsp:Transcript_23282/g.17699  ORF Transcript_23282/g.17699 Transcript_23282/m.17699 type:complete len:145 (+) Transcript_23282:1011-1445(+)
MSNKFPRPFCEGREEPSVRSWYEGILNDLYTSLPQGSESFKFKYKNQYEDVLFRTEDEMYKLDHEISNYKKTIQILEEEKRNIESLSEQEQKMYTINPRKFNRLRLKLIENVYGHLGQELLQLLPVDPIRAIPVVYLRLKQHYA